MDLPAKDKQELERIMQKDLNDLHADDIGFLNARKDYLSYQQKVTYQSVLNLESGELVEPAAGEGTQYTEVDTPPVEPAAAQPQTEEVNVAQTETNPEPEVTNGQDTVNPYGVDQKQQEELAQ